MPRIENMTPWKKFVGKWKGGCGSSICEGAKKCLARGKVPCDLLFVGEAPGESENVLGTCFVGPAGQLLDRIIARSVPENIRCALTNVVCCIPREDGGKASQPADEDVQCCGQRLYEFVEICRPRLIVCVGQVARDWLDTKYRYCIELPLLNDKHIPRIDIVHPAAILRANVAQRGLSIQRCVVQIQNAVEEYL